MNQKPQSASESMQRLHRPHSASMIHMGPSLGPPSSVLSAAKTNIGGARPPQVPRPPDAPKPTPTIKKPLGITYLSL